MKLNPGWILSRSAVAAVLLLGASAGGGAAAAPGKVVAIVDATVFDATGSAPHLANVVIRDKDGRTGDDLTEVELMGSRKGGRKLWLEVDNVAFY